MALTITEALAELKTIDKRMEKKQEFILAYLYRQDALKDPLERDGGSVAAIARERQSLADLAVRKVVIRRAIQDANATNQITVGKVTQPIADWLVWRRDVAPMQQRLLVALRNQINAIRADAQRKGLTVSSEGQTSRPQDFIVNINESELAKEQEALEEVLGTLDGLLSLKNATITVEV